MQAQVDWFDLYDIELTFISWLFVKQQMPNGLTQISTTVKTNPKNVQTAVNSTKYEGIPESQ